MPDHPATVGIDVGKDHLDVATLPAGGSYRVANDPDSHAQVAPTACMRKLLTILNAIAKTGRGWEPRPIQG